MADFGFTLIAAMVIATAFWVVTTSKLIHAAVALMGTLFGVAGLYVYLYADFLAATQVIIYVGGILVLLMFGVLLTNRPAEQLHGKEHMNYVIAGSAAAVLFFFVLARIIFSASWPTVELTEAMPSTRGIGRGLL
ncbi:MAG: NADH-quinone oxidoreductase subunit J, partial [Candidatus Marinimicrobia bacterium]|nr:NADH-quinone oxidoreductase subunit J [Candidatus Neomarinimicrobiota bacterium]